MSDADEFVVELWAKKLMDKFYDTLIETKVNTLFKEYEDMAMTPTSPSNPKDYYQHVSPKVHDMMEAFFAEFQIMGLDYYAWQHEGSFTYVQRVRTTDRHHSNQLAKQDEISGYFVGEAIITIMDSVGAPVTTNIGYVQLFRSSTGSTANTPEGTLINHLSEELTEASIQQVRERLLKLL